MSYHDLAYFKSQTCHLLKVNAENHEWSLLRQSIFPVCSTFSKYGRECTVQNV